MVNSDVMIVAQLIAFVINRCNFNEYRNALPIMLSALAL